jgi:hypothetical protein
MKVRLKLIGIFGIIYRSDYDLQLSFETFELKSKAIPITGRGGL